MGGQGITWLILAELRLYMPVAYGTDFFGMVDIKKMSKYIFSPWSVPDYMFLFYSFKALAIQAEKLTNVV